RKLSETKRDSLTVSQRPPLLTSTSPPASSHPLRPSSLPDRSRSSSPIHRSRTSPRSRTSDRASPETAVFFHPTHFSQMARPPDPRRPSSSIRRRNRCKSPESQTDRAAPRAPHKTSSALVALRPNTPSNSSPKTSTAATFP